MFSPQAIAAAQNWPENYMQSGATKKQLTLLQTDSLKEIPENSQSCAWLKELMWTQASSL